MFLKMMPTPIDKRVSNKCVSKKNHSEIRK